MHDYSSGSVIKGKPVATVDVVVRPGQKYGEASGGEIVRVDADEMRRGPTAATLYTPEEHGQALADERQRREALLAPKPQPVRDGIHAQLERMWSDAERNAKPLHHDGQGE